MFMRPRRMRIMRAKRAISGVFGVVAFIGGAEAASMDARTVNDVQWSSSAHSKSQITPMLIKAQVLLDRAHFSPGEIDGKLGGNFKKALTALAREKGLDASHDLSK